MGLFNRLLGFRWSLYIVRNENELLYAMHEHAVLAMIGYVMAYFANGGRPVPPWSLFINFNHRHKKIKLGPEHFTPDGESITPLLVQQIEAIDPGWKVKGGKPLFVEAATKKELKISNFREKFDFKAVMHGESKESGELTFYDIMDRVFGRI